RLLVPAVAGVWVPLLPGVVVHVAAAFAATLVHAPPSRVRARAVAVGALAFAGVGDGQRVPEQLRGVTARDRVAPPGALQRVPVDDDRTAVGRAVLHLARAVFPARPVVLAEVEVVVGTEVDARRGHEPAGVLPGRGRAGRRGGRRRVGHVAVRSDPQAA